MDQRMHTRVGL